jgi:transposase
MDTHTVGQASPLATDTLGRRTAPRRLRTAEEKLQIVRETLVAGASVAEIARRHGVNANLLFSWRRQHEQGVLTERTRPPRAARMLPVRLAAPSTLPSPTAAAPPAIEIELPCGARVRLIGDVTAERLTAVLRALARR